MYFGRTLSFFGFELSTHSESNDVQSVTVTVTILNNAEIHSALAILTKDEENSTYKWLWPIRVREDQLSVLPNNVFCDPQFTKNFTKKEYLPFLSSKRKYFFCALFKHAQYQTLKIWILILTNNRLKIALSWQHLSSFCL